MISKIWVDVGLISLTGTSAYWVGSQLENFLAHQPISKVVARALDECKGVEELVVAVANSILSQGGSSGTTLTLKLIAKQVSFLVEKSLTPCRMLFQVLFNEVEQWEKTSGKVGFLVLSSELIWNFLSHLSSSRCMADDILWASLRGGVSGALNGAKTGGSSWKRQMVLGAITGCGYGAFSSTIGVVAGKSVHVALKVLGCGMESDRKWGQIIGSGITVITLIKNS
jgi:hypothetical protein